MQRVKKNDVVVVIAGRYKGQKAKVLEVLTASNRVRLEGVDTRMVIKRHLKAGRTPAQRESAIVERPATVHVSNVMPWDEKAGKGARRRPAEG